MTRLLATTAVLALVSGSAMAWDAQTNGRGPQAIGQDGGMAQAQGQAQRQGQRQAQSVRNRVVVQNNISGAADPSGDPSGDPSNGHGGWNGNHQIPVASAYAPSFGTVNPCVGTSASLGGQFQLFGMTVGGQQMDEECRMLRLGTPQDVIAARNLICIQSSEARTAYYEAGLPCPQDRAKYQQAMAQPMPVSTTPLPSAAEALHGTAGADSFCSGNLSPAERRRYAKVCGK